MKKEYAVATEPLHQGITLIEASAGTGKTFTISGLFVRLVVQEGIPVREILVTTFTEAATAELRHRIRERLALALQAVHGSPVKDPLIVQLREAGVFKETEQARLRLEIALRAFDEAAIHTIHSFCERVLRERALESGALFDTELLTDQSAIFRELTEDYWRTHLTKAAPVIVAACIGAQLRPASLAALMSRQSAHPELRIFPEESEHSTARQRLTDLHEEFCRKWDAWAESVRAHFSDSARWATGIYNKPEVMAEYLELVGLCAKEATPPLEAFKALAVFAIDRLQEETGKRKVTPEHEFFTLCSEIEQARAGVVAAVQADFLTWARAELPQRMNARHLVSFDGLLTRLRDALAAPGGAALVDVVRGQFKAALVDEFQDTDPTQAEIFRALFACTDRRLFLIGDPKQAIYAFRGADVHAYLRVTTSAAHQFRLGTNQRSTAALVEAVNTIFSRAPGRFVVPAIDFEPVQPAGRADQEPLRIAGQSRAPFRFWMPEADADAPTAGALRQELPARVAAEVARMLDGRATVNGKPLQPKQCAVLTVSNRDAREVRAALGALRIPSVLFSDGSVFESDEATVMHTVLAAIVDPGRHSLLRTALSTCLFALTAAEIDALTTSEREWERWLLRFQEWHELWREHGFMRMFRTGLRDCAVRPRILASRNGERVLTNLLHLAELLHRAACEERLAPAALVHWLCTRQNEEVAAAEEYQLRLERDDDAVKIVTIHRSKGLEYDVVFCPFSWSGCLKGKEACFHDTGHGLTLDLRDPAAPESISAAQREQLEEAIRLFYVALTRARHECHFVWTQLDHRRSKDARISAANWLLHPAPAGDDPVAALRAHSDTLSAATTRSEIEQLVAQHPHALALDPLPDPKAAPPAIATNATALTGPRTFTGEIDRTWRVSSFSSLTEHHDVEQPDYDRAPAIAEAADPVLPPSGIHAFPAGKTAGICLHAIFEHLDFTDAAALRPLVAQHLARHSFHPAEWLDPVAECVERTLTVALAPGLSLRDVPLTARLTELEFYFPVAHLAPQDLTALLRDAGVERLSFEPRRGLLKGFIDLVFEHDGRFYIADWKSNRLGSDAAAYHQPALAAAMDHHRYGLQYHLYTLALHRYLRLRLGAAYDYEQHFGGVFYLFLRGIDPAQPDLGVFRARPTAERIAALDLLFASPAR